MPNTLRSTVPAMERNSLSEVAPKQLKAELRTQAPGISLREVASDARAHSLKLETAANSVGISESRLSHKLSDGSVTLAQLEQFGAEYVQEFARLLAERCQPTRDPRARVRQTLRDIRQKCDEVDQYLEFIAS